MKIHLFKLSVSNAYLIEGDRPILIDSGSPNDAELMRTKLRELDLEFSDLALIAHTHVHSDHMGTTAKILAEAKCPIAYHSADQAIVDRSTNGRLKGVGLRGKLMSRFFSGAKFDSVNADVTLNNGFNLKHYGADVTVIETPGHTAGSISFCTPNGDAIIGDVIMGGYLGGNLLPHKSNYHYFADDVSQAMTSLDTVLSQTTGTLFVGHGGPLTHASVKKWRQQQRKGQ